MGSNLEDIARRLEQLAAMQSEALAVIKTLEGRIDLMREELQRAYATLNRMGLSQESARHALKRQEKALEVLKEQVEED